MAKNLITLLDEYGLRKKIVAYVKDEGANLNIMTMALKYVVSFEILCLDKIFKVLSWALCFLNMSIWDNKGKS